jgi:hypothetical protein
MMDFAEIPDDGEIWELFARDFLQELDFFIETPPDRGPDAGKDMLVVEQLNGRLGNYKFRWLVSCKHNANAKKKPSVQEKHELNILERLKAFNADGFIGFYSTIPAAGLNTRLKELRDNKDIKDYKFFDHKLIESYLLTMGFSGLLMRYFPESYKVVKPLHFVFDDEYLPLECPVCKRDLLEAMYTQERMSIIAFEQHINYREDTSYVEDVFWACKEECDSILQDRFEKHYFYYNELSDMTIPRIFLEALFIFSDSLRSGKRVYSDQAFKKLKYVIAALSQKALREMTKNEKKRVQEIIDVIWF